MDSNSTQSPSLAGLPRTAAAPAALIVLDTNVVLDWLVFQDPSSAPFAAAIERGQVRWIASPGMRDELAHVLSRGLAARRDTEPARVLARWDALAEAFDAPAQLPGPGLLRCSDPDDQQFLDLARAAGARWLLSRDRAVLRLARAASRLNLRITVPERWRPSE